MTVQIQEYKTALPNKLCDDIIQLFHTETPETYESPNLVRKVFAIPKNSTAWSKVEKVLYKVLLMSVKKFEQTMYDIHTLNNTASMRGTMILDAFSIQEYVSHGSIASVVDFRKKLSRYNVLTFIYFLNTVDMDIIEITIDGSTYAIRPTKGSLYIFTENVNYRYRYRIPIETMDIITGQLRSKISKL